MSHPISKLFQRRVTLAIAASGIALNITDYKTHVLTAADFQWQQANQLKTVIESHHALFRQQAVDVVLSNVLVRYTVLPWQDGVLKSSDWQVIAQHAFRSQYGAVAQHWHVAVQLGAFGRPVLAAAIDQSLIETLSQSAEQYGFTIYSITPLLPLLRGLYPHDSNQWALIAEPARLLLCQFKQGDWVQVQVDVPAMGEEYKQSEQLITRSMLVIKPSEQPSVIASYVAPSLHPLWQIEPQSKQRRQFTSVSKASHAAWLASLPVTNQRLDFVGDVRPKAGLVTWLGLAVCLGLMLICVQWFQAAQQEKQALQDRASKVYWQPSRSAPNPAMDAQMAFAQQAQQQLNTPWLAMLAALEAVNQQNKEIAITQLNPNSTRGEIKIKAETSAFKHITAYLDGLRASPAFGDATLTSQHLEQEEGKQEQAAGRVIYVFEVTVRWQP